MTLFDKLPVVENCCFCINLKLGCIFIAIFGILNSSAEIYLILIPDICKSSDGIFAWLLKIFAYMISVTNILFLLANILFLVGIFINRRVTAMLYLYCSALSVLVFISFFICAILVTVFEKDCNVHVQLFSTIIGLMLSIYFIIVVRSYKDEMD